MTRLVYRLPSVPPLCLPTYVCNPAPIRRGRAGQPLLRLTPGASRCLKWDTAGMLPTVPNPHAFNRSDVPNGEKAEIRAASASYMAACRLVASSCCSA